MIWYLFFLFEEVLRLLWLLRGVSPRSAASGKLRSAGPGPASVGFRGSFPVSNCGTNVKMAAVFNGSLVCSAASSSVSSWMVGILANISNKPVGGKILVHFLLLLSFDIRFDFYPF